MKSPAILTVIIILLVALFMPVVAAEQTRDMDIVFYVQHNPDLNYTRIINIANDTDEQYTNWNATVKPFMENNTDIRGRCIVPITFPYIFNMTATSDISLAQYIRFSPSDVMNGISQFWVRVPIENLTTNAIINVRLYRTWVSSMSFWAAHDATGPTFISGTNLIYNMTDNLNPGNRVYHDYVRNSTVSVLNQTLNFTWVKVSAPIIPKDNYIIYMNITNITNNVRLAVSGCDLGNDEIYRSYLWTDTQNMEMDLDMDAPIILTVGMGGGVSGARSVINNSTYDYFYWMHNRTVGRIITNATGSNLQYIIPYITNETENITFGALAYANSTLISQHILTHNNVRGKQFICGHINMSGDIPGPGGLYISHVVVFMRINATNATNLGIYLETQTDGNYNGVQVYGFFGNAITPGVMWYEVHGFATFGYFEFETSHWENVQAEFILLNYDEPNTTAAITLIYQRMQMALYSEEGSHLGFWDIVAWGADRWLSLMIPAYLLTQHWEEVSEAAIDTLTVLFGDNFMAFGAMIWDNLTVAIDTLVALGYISAKAFYGIFVMLVYFLFISSCILVCESGLSWSQQWPRGGFNAFISTLNAGWPRVGFIIDILIKLITLALIILNAVYGVIKFW